jgi:phosphate transport system protein
LLRHFEEELDELRKLLLEMSGLVESAIYRSVLSLVRKDDAQAQEVSQNESRINQLQIQIDDRATRLLALEQPVARDLRFITAAIKINGDLERMGDEAVNIVERSLLLMHEPQITAPIDIPHMANLVQSMVRKALDSFVKKDVEMAREVLASDDAVDEMKDAIIQVLAAHMQDHPDSVRQCVNLILVAHNLERIADHATNVAEDVIYLAEGVDVRHHAETREE